MLRKLKQPKQPPEATPAPPLPSWGLPPVRQLLPTIAPPPLANTLGQQTSLTTSAKQTKAAIRSQAVSTALKAMLYQCWPMLSQWMVALYPVMRPVVTAWEWRVMKMGMAMIMELPGGMLRNPRRPRRQWHLLLPQVHWSDKANYSLGVAHFDKLTALTIQLFLQLTNQIRIPQRGGIHTLCSWRLSHLWFSITTFALH